MKAKLIVEGREFPIEIQDPELQKLLEQKKETGYERVDKDSYYFYDIDGRAVQKKDLCSSVDCSGYEAANYYSSEEVAENNARADKLMRQLRRFAVEHRENPLDWKSAFRSKYYIDYNHGRLIFDIFSNEIYQTLGVVYFDSYKAAKLAVDTFHDELIWYFTEYKDSL